MKVYLTVVLCALVLAQVNAVRVNSAESGVRLDNEKRQSSKQARKLPGSSQVGQMGQMGGFGGFMGGQNMLAMPSLTPPEAPGFTLGRMPIYGPGGPQSAPQMAEKAENAENDDVDQKDQKAKNRKLFFPFMNPMMMGGMMNPMMMGGMMNPMMMGMMNPMMYGPYMNMAMNSTMASTHHHIKGNAHMGMAMMHHGAGSMHTMMNPMVNPMMNPMMMGGMMNPMMMGGMMGGMMNPMMMGGMMNPMMNPMMMGMMGGMMGGMMNPYGGYQNFGNNQPAQQPSDASAQAFTQSDEKALRRKLTDDEINTVFYAGELPSKMQREMNLQENLENAEINEQLGALEGVSKQDSNWIKEMDNNVSKL